MVGWGEEQWSLNSGEILLMEKFRSWEPLGASLAGREGGKHLRKKDLPSLDNKQDPPKRIHQNRIQPKKDLPKENPPKKCPPNKN